MKVIKIEYNYRCRYSTLQNTNNTFNKYFYSKTIVKELDLTKEVNTQIYFLCYQIL